MKIIDINNLIISELKKIMLSRFLSGFCVGLSFSVILDYKRTNKIIQDHLDIHTYLKFNSNTIKLINSIGTEQFEKEMIKSDKSKENLIEKLTWIESKINEKLDNCIILFNHEGYATIPESLFFRNKIIFVPITAIIDEENLEKITNNRQEYFSRDFKSPLYHEIGHQKDPVIKYLFTYDKYFHIPFCLGSIFSCNRLLCGISAIACIGTVLGRKYCEKKADLIGFDLAKQDNYEINYVNYFYERQKIDKEIRDIVPKFRKIFIKENGDDYFDIVHPLISKRIQYLQEKLNQSSKNNT